MLKVHLVFDPGALPESYRSGFPVVFTPHECNRKADLAACGTLTRAQRLTTAPALVTCGHCRKL